MVLLAALLAGILLALFLVLHLTCRIVSSGALLKLGVPSASETQDLVWLRSYEWENAQITDQVICDSEADEDSYKLARELAQSGEREKAFEIWLRLAGNGLTGAMGDVARCYQWGEGIAPDQAKAEEWWEQAALHGSQYGILGYATVLRRRRDYAAVEALFSSDSLRNWPPSWFWLAYARLRQSRTRADYARALPLLEQAAECGCPIAKYLLAQWMTWGRFGLMNIPRGFKIKFESSSEIVDIISEAYPDTLFARKPSPTVNR